jgi:Tfp pilus assembly protein PilN
MLRINLLPPYIYDEKKKKMIAAWWVLGVLACCVAYGLAWSKVNGELKEAQDAKTTAENFKSQYDSLENQIATAKQQGQAINDRQTFIANAQKYNDGWPKTYREVRDLTSPQVILREVSLSGTPINTVNMLAYAPSETDAIRWLMYLRTRTDKVDRVQFQLPPHGYLTDNQTAGGGGARMGGMSMPGMMGGGMSMPGMMGGGMRAGGIGPMGASGGGGGNNQQVGPTDIEGRPGLSFVATAVLKEPVAGGIALPAWPAGFGGAVGGGGARIPGMPGGMSGGPMGGGGSFGGGGLSVPGGGSKGGEV